jgi:hypothetical protein
MLKLRRAMKIIPALLFALCVIKGAETLPSQLSDEVFWKLVEDGSELTQQFPGENYVSNEPKYATAIRAVKQSVMPGGVYVGVGPEQNFSYIAALKPKMAFVVDIRRQNLVEQLMYKALFDLADDRADFLSRLFSRKRPEGLTATTTTKALMDAYVAAPASTQAYDENLDAIRKNLTQKHSFRLTAEDNATLEKIFKVFATAGAQTNYVSPNPPNRNSPGYAELMTSADADGNTASFLATEESYKVVRDMHRRNLIVPLVGDFAGPKAIKSIGTYLKKYDATVRLFYLSNVETYLFAGSGPGAPTAATRAITPNGGWQTFFENVSTLPLDSSSTFIRFQGAAGEPQLASIQKNLESVKAGTLTTYPDLFPR